MPMLSKGRYKAKVNSVKVDRKGANKLACISVMFEGYEWKNDATGEYEAIPESGYSIIADKFIEKKDGTLNEAGIKQLAEVFEWNGSVESVADFVGKHAKITVVDDVWNGKTTPKVDWINHIDSGDHDGGGEYFTFDHSAAKQVQSALGSKIRALLGATKPAPARPAAPAAPRPAPPASSAPANTLDSVYAAFEDMCAKELKGSHDVAPEERVIHSNWYMFLKATYGHEDSAAVTDWTKAANAVEGYRGEILPF